MTKTVVPPAPPLVPESLQNRLGRENPMLAGVEEEEEEDAEDADTWDPEQW